MTAAYDRLPDGLPVPDDDGAADHLVGLPVPAIVLPATTGTEVDLAGLSGRVVVYLYPMTGRPGVALPPGWDEIPGARGCTPETIGFRDNTAALAALGIAIYGLSSQDSAYQRELVQRLELAYPVLSDPAFGLARALSLPTFESDGERLYKRLTLVIRDGRIEHVFYPIFPTDTHAAQVLAWAAEHPIGAS